MKLLTSVRVSQKQKNLDIDIPKLSEFVHKIYIHLARKIYSNVYLFEKDIMPLQYQKNMRECELLCRESILSVIRDSIPVEKILRAYIDETTDEEIIEELIEKNVNAQEAEKLEKEIKERNDEREKKLEEEDTIDNNLDKNETNEKTINQIDNDKEESKELSTINNIKENFQDTLKVLTEKLDKSKAELNNKLKTVDDDKKENNENKKSDHLTFNDNDAVLDMGTNKESIVSAPKDIERLDKIAEINDAKEKQKKLNSMMITMMMSFKNT